MSDEDREDAPMKRFKVTLNHEPDHVIGLLTIHEKILERNPIHDMVFSPGFLIHERGEDGEITESELTEVGLIMEESLQSVAEARKRMREVLALTEEMEEDGKAERIRDVLMSTEHGVEDWVSDLEDRVDELEEKLDRIREVTEPMLDDGTHCRDYARKIRGIIQHQKRHG